MERTHRIMFVCHGNICRSPMAEFLLKDMIKKEGLADRFVIASAGTSREEIGNPVHQGTRKKLAQDHISAAGKYAVQLTKEDYEKYDLILGMDRANISNILRIIGSDPQEKVHRLLDFTELPRDIADPWYTGDFEITYAEIKAGCAALLKHLRRLNILGQTVFDKITDCLIEFFCFFIKEHMTAFCKSYKFTIGD